MRNTEDKKVVVIGHKSPFAQVLEQALKKAGVNGSIPLNKEKVFPPEMPRVNKDESK